MATSYPETVRSIADKKDFLSNLVPCFVEGAAEGEVAAGRADMIFDIVSSGKTLEANGLVKIGEAYPLKLFVLKSIKMAKTLEESLAMISKVYQDRISKPTSSLTSTLLSDENARTKKLGQEAFEFIRAALDADCSVDDLVGEAADVLYALNMFLVNRGLSTIDILKKDIERANL